MATLILKNINKIYPNKVQAVFDFNLEIKDKEFVVFVGPSGCGKSTTLRMVAGLEDITSGELLIDGELMNNVAPKDRNIAMVFQSYALYPHMTVYGNMKFALKLRKVPKPLYQENPDILPLQEEIKEIRKEIHAIDRKFKKDQNNLEYLPPRAELYKKLYEIEDKITSMLTPVVGIDEMTIKSLEKAVARLTKEIAVNEKLIAKYAEEDPEGAEMLKASNANREKQIAIYNEKIEFLRNNEVELKKMRHLTRHEMDLEINKVAESIDLTRYLFRKPSALSGGQRQRVALGRAIVRKPKVFLMDEPLSNLDAKLRVQTRSEIAKIHQRVGATTIYVTHDQTEAMTMANRIVIMKDGWIQQIGTPKEVYDDPANKFVGGFIGSPAMNFITGTVNKGVFSAMMMENEQGAVGAEKFDLKLSKEQVAMLKDYDGKKVILGVRPETVHLSNDKVECKLTESINSTCDFAELLGYEFVIYTYICGQRITLKTPQMVTFKPGDPISIAMDMDKLYFFDSETEARIK